MTKPPRGCWLAGHVLLGASVEAARDPARDVPWGDQTWDEMNAG